MYEKAQTERGKAFIVCNKTQKKQPTNKDQKRRNILSMD